MTHTTQFVKVWNERTKYGEEAPEKQKLVSIKPNYFDFSSKLNKIIILFKVTEEVLLYYTLSYVYLALCIAPVPSLKQVLIYVLGFLQHKKKGINFMDNPTVNLRYANNKYPAPQTTADRRQCWFSIAKLLSSSVHGKHRASMWNNPEIKTWVFAALIAYIQGYIRNWRISV